MAEHNAVLTNIMTILGDSNLDESFVEMVLKRLESLSYTVQDGDDWAVAFSIQKTESKIKNNCNISSIPDGLKHTAVDMVCGDFLLVKKQTGKLDDVFHLETAIKSIQEGDTNVTFATEGSQTPEQRFNLLIDYLVNHKEGDFVCYRKLKW